MKTASVAALTLLAAACTVPELMIDEQSSSATEIDAAVTDASAAGDSDQGAGGSNAKPAVRSGTAAAGGKGGKGGKSGSAAGSGGKAAAVGAHGGQAAPAQAGAGGVAGEPRSTTNSGSAGNAGADGPDATMPATRNCAVWTRVDVRDTTPPAGAVEGGFETVAGVTNRQYVCRFRPAGSSYTIPGKYLPGLGCYVTVRRDAQQVDDASMLDGMIDVLTPAAGCSFSWRTATGSELPAGVVDLGDPAGGRNYACHGDYSAVASSGKQIGTLIASSDVPPQNQCYFESFSNAIQPTDPQLFEVLVQD